MGEVLRFDLPGSSRSNAAVSETLDAESADAESADAESATRARLERERARYYITSAAAILSSIGEPERRVSWLLEDCAGLLSERETCGLNKMWPE